MAVKQQHYLLYLISNNEPLWTKMVRAQITEHSPILLSLFAHS